MGILWLVFAPSLHGASTGMGIHGWSPREPAFGAMGAHPQGLSLLPLDVFCLLKEADMETEAYGPGILISLVLTAVGWDRGVCVKGIKTPMWG